MTTFAEIIRSPKPCAEGPSLTWSNVGFEIAVPSPLPEGASSWQRALSALGRTNKKWVPLLQNISGAIYGGDLMAIMGPSGSGKTTLLHVLAQRLGNGKDSRVSGRILLNGHVPDKTSRRQCAFVFQDEIMMSNLSVRDTVRFSALLRTPSSTSKELIEAKVNETIVELGLQRCADTLVGGPSRRGVSGGEKKRTAIAAELVASPHLLFLDEPTSGLDAATALGLGATLKRIAQSKKDLLIITAIHQPRLKLFELFTKVCLLRHGRMQYLGPQHGAVERLEDIIGVRMPPRVSPPDWMLDVLTEIDLALLEKSNMEAVDVPAEVENLKGAAEEDAKADEVPTGSGETDAESGFKEEVSRQQAERLSSLLEDAALKSAGVEDGSSQNKEGEREECNKLGNTCANSSWWQFQILLQRQALQQRGEIFSQVYIFQILAVAVIASLVWLQSEDVGDILGVLFFVNIQQSFNTINGVLKVFPPERQLMLRERDAGAYRTFPYFMAKSLSDFSSIFIFPVIYAVTVYYAVGLRDGADRFFVFVALFLLAIIVAQSIGLIIGAYVPDIALANSINFVLVLLIMLFGGFYVDVDNIPTFLSWIRYLSFMFWSYSGMVVNEFEDRDLDCDNAREGEYSDNCREEATVEEKSLGFNGDEVIEALSFQNAEIYRSCVVLIWHGGSFSYFGVLVFTISMDYQRQLAGETVTVNSNNRSYLMKSFTASRCI